MKTDIRDQSPNSKRRQFMQFIVEENFAGRQSKGQRDIQEDFYVFSDGDYDETGKMNTLLLAVADGMGGHAAGELASYATVKGFIEGFHSSSGSIRERLQAGLEQANEGVRLEGSKNSKRFNGMGSTLVAAIIDPQWIHWISVGDSILILLRDGKISRLNADHSLAPLLQAQIARGEIDENDEEIMALGNSLQSAIMGDHLELIDLPDQPTQLKPGDIIVAASDGVLTLHEDRIESLLNENSDQSAAQITNSLLKAVDHEEDLFQDNTTVAVIKIPTASATTTPSPSTTETTSPTTSPMP